LLAEALCIKLFRINTCRVSVIQGPSCKGRVNYYRRVESRGELISSVKTPSLLAIAMA
jgi:hypothetical protein